MTRTFLGIAAVLALTAGSPPRARQASSRPRLVVLLMVDQMRADYLERYDALLQHGLERLTRSGAWYTQAALPYMNTVTCAGHGTAGTGTFPYKHGMIQNEWYMRDAHVLAPCTEDLSTKEIPYGPYGGAGDSASRLLQPTLAELLYKAGGRSVSLSLKARSAIGMAGHAGTDVIWFDERNGWFTTSTAFARQADPIVAAFVRAHPVDAYRGRTWERTLPPSRYLYDDEADGERPGSGWGSAFPHPLGADDRTFSGRWEKSPFSDDYLEQMAEASIDGLKLGQGSTTDFLGISFSALDLVGHAFGPRSHEVQDVLVRLDATIDRLLRHLDETVGRDRYVVALSADHGVSDVPEQVNGARLSPEVMVRVVDAVLRPILKDAPPATLQDVIRPFAGEGVYVAAVANTDIYLREGVYDRIRAVPGAVDALVRGLGTIPSVARVLRSDELSGASARSSADPLIRAAALSYVAGRSGDLVVVPVENAIASTAAATHGTAYEYDQRIPVIFYGAGVRTGRYTEPASSADIAVTLGARAGVSLPLPDGHVLAAAAAR